MAKTSQSPDGARGESRGRVSNEIVRRRGEAPPARVAADAKKLLGGAERLSFGDVVDPGKALARLAKEREASRTKLEQYEQELRSLRRANETLRRAGDADRKTFFFEKKRSPRDSPTRRRRARRCAKRRRADAATRGA